MRKTYRFFSLFVALFAAMFLAFPGVAMARGGGGGGGGGHSSGGFSSSSGSHSSYSGSRSSGVSSSGSGSRSGGSAPAYSGSRSGSTGSGSRAPSYSGSRSSGVSSGTRIGGSGPRSLPRSTTSIHVVVLPTHPAYGTLYAGHYFYHGVYYPYYYDGTYYPYNPVGYVPAAAHSGGMSGWFVFLIVILVLAALGGLAWFLTRRPARV